MFGWGYLANTGVIGALARRGEAVFWDELNHASIIDGCRLAGAPRRPLSPWRPRGARSGACARVLGRAELIVTEGVFWMNGDVAQLGGERERRRALWCRG